MNNSVLAPLAVLGALALASVDAPAATPTPEVVLTERSAYDGVVTISVPQGFTVMSDAMLRAKYPDQVPPEAAYTDASGNVNLTMSLPAETMDPNQLAEAHRALDGALRGAYPAATWYRSEVFERDGRRYFILDLMTPAADSDVRNVILGTPFRGRLLVVTFNVTRELAPAWIETGQKMMASLKFKDS